MNSKISVIIPFYSNREWLEEAIDSVEKQTYTNFEIILINDGSSENIDDLFNAHNKIIYIEQENKGAAVARNVGIERATGDYVAFLDADDLWEPRKLENQLKKMIETQANWSHTDYVRFSEKNDTIDKMNLAYFNGNIYPRCLASNPIATPCVMIKRSILRDNKEYRFKEKMKFGEDLYFWLMLAQEHPILHVQESLTKVRIHGKNASLSAYSQIKSRSEMWESIKNTNIANELKKHDRIILRTYMVCGVAYSIIRKIKPSGLQEIISKIAYIIPWIIFKYKEKKL